MKVTVIAVKRRIATAVIAIALVVLGIYGLLLLPVNFLPDITYPMIKIHVWWRGATPDEINTNLADPIERQMASVDGLDYLESSAIEGMYTLLVNFKYSVNIDTAYQDCLAAMARVARQLPKDIDPPIVIKADPSQLPVVQLTARSDQWDLTQLRTWADDWLQPRLLAVPGVAGAEVVGGLKREIRVLLDSAAMEKHGLAMPAVLKRLQEENLAQFGGRVTSGTKEIIARTMGEYRSLTDIKNIVLAGNGVGKLTLGDIAEVKDSHEDVRVITRFDGQPTVKISVLKQADANTVEVARGTASMIRELRGNLPGGIELGMVENQADYVLPAIKGVANAAAESAVLVIIVIFLFLGSWRQVMVMLVALPLTLVLNFALMKLGGFSLNIFSLGGLVVAIGVILDNSIVVIENITRLRHEYPSTQVAETAIAGTAEVGRAILAATLSFIALFFPFLLVPGLTTLLFKELILVVAGIVCLSLAVALTLTPMLTAILLGGRGMAGAGKNRFEIFYDRIAACYTRALSWTLRFRWLTIIAFLVALAATIALAPRLGGEFLPQMDDGRIVVKVKLPTGAAVGETDRVLHDIEAKLQGDPVIESAFTLVGGKVWGLYTYEIANEGEIDIQLVPRHKRDKSTQEYLRQLRPMLAKMAVPGGKVMAMQAKIKGLRSLGEADIEIKIKGDESDKLFALAKKTAETMNGLKNFTNVRISTDMTKPEFQVIVDRVRAAELGISVAEVATTAKSLLSGEVVTQFRDGDRFYNIRAMLPEDRVTSRQDVENMIIGGNRGGYVHLGDIAQVRQATGPVEIVREDQVKTIVIRGDALNVSVGAALTTLQAALQKDLQLPVGYRMDIGGEAKMMADMRTNILLVLAFAVFFSFVVLAVQFNSLKLPALILTGIPFSAAGLILALYLAKLPVGATVLIGLLVAVSAVVNEGVLLLEFVEKLQTEKKISPFEAVMQAATIRLRPRLMVATAAIFGLIPLALNLEEGGDMLQPMAVGAIGGLAMGIPVALFLLPCLYLVFSRKPETIRTHTQEESSYAN